MRRPRTPLSPWRDSRVRRLAAERVADEELTGLPRVDTPGDSRELTDEIEAIRRLARTLERVPVQAWPPQPPAHRAANPSTSRLRSRIAPGLATTLAAATLAVAFVVGSVTHPLGGTSTHSATEHAIAHVVLHPLPGSGAEHSQAVAYMTGGQHMLVRLARLPRTRPSAYYELWLMTSTTHLISVTSFRVGRSGGGTLEVLLPDDPAHYRYLDISVQHVGAGSEISGESVLRGTLPA